MDRELLTRNSMTGWMMLVAFLAAYNPPAYLPWVRHLVTTAEQGNTAGLTQAVVALAGIVLAVMGTPFIGFMVGGLVNLLCMLARGHIYTGRARACLRQWFKKQIQADKSVLGQITDDDVFVYYFYRNAPQTFLEWGRRWRTAQWLGYNWFVATVIGVVVGAFCDPHFRNAKLICAAVGLAAGLVLWWRIDRRFTALWLCVQGSIIGVVAVRYYELFLAQLVWPILVLVVACVQLHVGRVAETEADDVECLWAADYVGRCSQTCQKQPKPRRKGRIRKSD